jgi:hypothetical protein
MAGLMNTTVFCIQCARPNVRLASVHRNEVPTVVAFRTLQEAQRARAILWNKTWAYNAWGEVLIMMPLKTLVCEEGGKLGIWRTTPNVLLRRGMNKFGVDVCEVDPDDVLCVSRALFVHKDVAMHVMSQQLAATWQLKTD